MSAANYMVIPYRELYGRIFNLEMPNFKGSGYVFQINLRNHNMYRTNITGENEIIYGNSLPALKDNDILDVKTYDVSFDISQFDLRKLTPDINLILLNP